MVLIADGIRLPTEGKNGEKL